MTRLKFNDEGKVYNHLKILHKADSRINNSGNKETRVIVECLLCGNTKNLSWSKVKSGWTKTCGCTSFGARKDITGQRFGKLVAKESLQVKKFGSVLWKCSCDCGNDTELTVSQLGSGNFQSCGCMQHQGRPLDLKDKIFGRLTAVESVGKNKAGQYIWKCICECGNEHTTTGTNLVENHTKSCGCLSRESLLERSKTHGWANTPEYGAWKNAISRCTDPANPAYENYGGRGIKVCDRWMEPSPRGILNFIEDMGSCNNLTLDRIDVNGDYEPDNCRWADYYTQSYNTRMFKNNTSGRTGVSQMKDGKWQAYITNRGIREALGIFVNFEDAVRAREKAEVRLHGEVKEMK